MVQPIPIWILFRSKINLAGFRKKLNPHHCWRIICLALRRFGENFKKNSLSWGVFWWHSTQLKALRKFEGKDIFYARLLKGVFLPDRIYPEWACSGWLRWLCRQVLKVVLQFLILNYQVDSQGAQAEHQRSSCKNRPNQVVLFVLSHTRNDEPIESYLY